jgi:hypothetical protein
VSDIGRATMRLKRAKHEYEEAKEEHDRELRLREKLRPMVEHYLSLPEEDFKDVLNASTRAYEIRFQGGKL